MSEKTVLICNHCGKVEDESSAVGWKHIRIVGLDDTRFGDNPFPADLCSPKCIIEYLRIPLEGKVTCCV